MSEAQAIDADREARELVEDVVRIPSVSRDEGEAAAYLAEFFETHDREVWIDEVGNVRAPADDADEGGTGPHRGDSHGTQRALRVDAPAAPQHLAVVGLLDPYWNIARDGVDVGGQQDAVVGGCADVADLVYPHLAVVVLEELDEALGALALLARR